jgi:hypothetical protein
MAKKILSIQSMHQLYIESIDTALAATLDVPSFGLDPSAQSAKRCR